MAGKKKGNPRSSSSDNKNKPSAKKTETNGKEEEPNHKPTATGGGSTTTSSVPLLVCVVIGLLSLACGLVSPHLWKALQEQQAASSNLSYRELKEQKKPTNISPQKKKKKKKKAPEMLTTSHTHEFPCNQDALSKVLHDNKVPGMHVICMDQTMKSLQVTLYPEAQQTDTPIVAEMEGLPEWILFKTTLRHHLKLRDMDELHQPWSLFSPDGELLVKENHENEQVDVQGLVQMGMILLYQGGQFLWPGVRIGFKRTIDLYSVMPAGSPSFRNKHRSATLETISLQPLVFSVEGFLEKEECDYFQEAASPTLAYSEVSLMDMDAGRPASDFRTSQSTFLQSKSNPTMKDIDYRTASLVRVPRFHQEHVQVLRYGGGEKYDAHHDYFDKKLYKNDEDTLKNFIQYGRRNRFITVFWYLSDVEEGGETVFPRFGNAPQPRNMSDCQTGLKVKPVRGKVIIFYSLKADGSMDPLSLHGACPVKKGIKWAANKWVWNAPIEFGSGR